MRERKEIKITTPPWTDLPKDLLEIISSFLPRFDVSRLRAVCRSWRSSITPFQNPVSLPHIVPYLTPLDVHRHPPHPIILAESTVYHVSPPPHPQPAASSSSASSSSSSSWGWLLKLKHTQAPTHFHVLNCLPCTPTRRFFPAYPKVINLLDFQVSELAKAYSLHPPNDHNPACKVVVSSSSSSIVRIAAGVLCHLKIGDLNWTVIDDSVSQLDYEDVILYKKKFCAVDENGMAVVINSCLKVMEIASPLKGVDGTGHRKILVESAGDLLLVDRYVSTEDLLRVKFKVFKLKEEEKQWVEVKSLNGRIMFLGDDCSFCVAAKDFGNGCKGNCIFFNHFSKFTVFDLEDSTLKPVQGHPAYKNIFYTKFLKSGRNGN